MSAECICYPCTTGARGAPWLDHCAACCYGTLVQEYHHDCPVDDHAAMAVRQFGPINALSNPTAATEAPGWLLCACGHARYHHHPACGWMERCECARFVASNPTATTEEPLGGTTGPLDAL